MRYDKVDLSYLKCPVLENSSDLILIFMTLSPVILFNEWATQDFCWGEKKKTHSQNLNLLFDLVIAEVFLLFSVYVSQFYSVFKTSLCAWFCTNSLLLKPYQQLLPAWNKLPIGNLNQKSLIDHNRVFRVSLNHSLRGERSELQILPNSLFPFLIAFA